MGCSAQKGQKDNHKNAVAVKQNPQQTIIQSEMPDSNREFLIQIKNTCQSKGMVHRQNQMYPEGNQIPNINQYIQQVNTILNSQNVPSLSSFGKQEEANSDPQSNNKVFFIPNSQNLRSIIKSNTPKVSKQQKNVTFKQKRLTRSPLSDKQFRRNKVTLEHLERIF